MTCGHISATGKAFLRPDDATCATVDSRRYCEACGLVREETGRGPAYFIDRLQEVQRMLAGRERRLGTPPLTQAEHRLIIMALGTDPLFADPYGSRFERQRERFIGMLERQRPNVPKWMFEDIVVKTEKHRRGRTERTGTERTTDR